MIYQNKIILLTAPSGSGKTSITRYLLECFPDKLAFSISAATRPPREKEKNGIDYYFLSQEDFNIKIREDAFAEWEMVYDGKYYGTLKSELQRIWNKQQIPLLDIDVKGAIHVKKQFPQSLGLFIMPPSVDELKRRLYTRGTDSDESIRARVNKAKYELSFKDHFDHVLLNDDLEKACIEAKRLVENFISS
ncbi:MAG: guanylate kinase [Chitinophagaceae bacterium]|jgi:guanylate kinase|nr:guanylate kinase [Chitinophagaceae bacterium]